ncbi:MAG: polysaccharide biosynthesis protein [Actinobacteria bacterium]|jgi:FlaA1/EpsC-like NDP-sugar epimerase|nr:MAG: polysaccharide biosynthesis protein [Actinomycetota bacterium]
MPKARRFIVSTRPWKIAIDLVAVFLGFIVSLAVRFEFAIPSDYMRSFWLAIPVVIALFLVMNFLMRIYSGRWKYASFDELLNLASAATIATSLLFFVVVIVPGARSYIPLSVAVMGGVLALFVMAFARLQFRLLGEMRMRRGQRGGKRVLIIGAGEAGEMIARDMLRHPEYDYSPVGFVDDDPGKRKLVIQGIPVMGGREDIPKIVKRQEVDEIFIAIPSASGEMVRGILTFCEETGAKIKILPGIFQSMAGEIGVAAVREIQLEDLLGREPVETDLASISAYVTDKVILVTGAGGSIGSELARQLAGLGPKLLLLLDNDETALFDMECELTRALTPCPFHVLVADIRDFDRILSIFRRYRPQVVFHSAALKHVPMMEYHPSEAVKNNVYGTRNLAEASIYFGVERFILISTDKAVHPVNVMGATKRVSEMLLKGYSGIIKTLFTAVRFGNVLGSRGSVVPTFMRQIEEGGPVLVTHPEITRYFMTVQEAAQLVIQAGAFTRGGDTFILDMGEPVRIIDLAAEMLRLMGKEKTVKIKVTGLRPGEKLHEELSFPVEELMRTPHPKIDKVWHEKEVQLDLVALVDGLIAAAMRDDEERVRVLLAGLVPTYEPSVPGTGVGPGLMPLRAVAEAGAVGGSGLDMPEGTVQPQPHASPGTQPADPHL